MTYRALLICNSTFPEDPASLPELLGPRTDGLVLWRALTDRQYGCFELDNVAVLAERTAQEIMTETQLFFKQASKNDVALFYYSGHGRRNGQDLMLCARNTTVPLLETSGVSAELLKKLMLNSHARAIVVILDCCHAGAFKKGEDLSHDLAGEGQFVLAAARSSKPADDADTVGKPSPFTAVLTRALLGEADGASGSIDLDDLFKYVESNIGRNVAAPHRNFDGRGAVPIARLGGPASSEPVLRENMTGDRIDVPVAPKTGADFAGDDPNYIRDTIFKLQQRPRRGLTLADTRAWIIWVISGLSLAVVGMLEFDVATSVTSYSSESISFVAKTCLLGVLVGGLISVFAVAETMYKRQMKFAENTAYSGMVWLGLLLLIGRSARIAKYALSIGACTGALLISIMGRGFWDVGWVLQMTLAGVLGLLAVLELGGKGGNAYLAGGILVALAAFFPTRIFSNSNEYPLNSLSGWWVLIGAVTTMLAWHFAAPSIALGVALSPAFLSYVHVFYDRHFVAGPCVGLVGLVLSVIALLLGTGRPFVLQLDVDSS